MLPDFIACDFAESADLLTFRWFFLMIETLAENNFPFLKLNQDTRFISTYSQNFTSIYLLFNSACLLSNLCAVFRFIRKISKISEYSFTRALVLHQKVSLQASLSVEIATFEIYHFQNYHQHISYRSYSEGVWSIFEDNYFIAAHKSLEFSLLM